MTKTIIYLHGFASSPQSTKSNTFRARLKQDRPNIDYLAPDLNVPDFEHLTLSAMIEKTAQVTQTCNSDNVYLIGSSLGGLVATHFLNQYRGSIAKKVQRVILMAPAFDFVQNRQRQLGDEGLANWKASGWLKVEHYAYETTTRIHYGLLEDALRYDSFSVDIPQPMLIFHGKNDDVVDHQQSIRFAENRDNVELRLTDSDHTLYDEADNIYQAILTFFAL